MNSILQEKDLAYSKQVNQGLLNLIKFKMVLRDIKENHILIDEIRHAINELKKTLNNFKEELINHKDTNLTTAVENAFTSINVLLSLQRYQSKEIFDGNFKIRIIVNDDLNDRHLIQFPKLSQKNLLPISDQLITSNQTEEIINIVQNGIQRLDVINNDLDNGQSKLYQAYANILEVIGPNYGIGVENEITTLNIFSHFSSINDYGFSPSNQTLITEYSKDIGKIHTYQVNECLDQNLSDQILQINPDLISFDQKQELLFNEQQKEYAKLLKAKSEINNVVLSFLDLQEEIWVANQHISPKNHPQEAEDLNNQINANLNLIDQYSQADKWKVPLKIKNSNITENINQYDLETLGFKLNNGTLINFNEPIYYSILANAKGAAYHNALIYQHLEGKFVLENLHATCKLKKFDEQTPYRLFHKLGSDGEVDQSKLYVLNNNITSLNDLYCHTTTLENLLFYKYLTVLDGLKVKHQINPWFDIKPIITDINQSILGAKDSIIDSLSIIMNNIPSSYVFKEQLADYPKFAALIDKSLEEYDDIAGLESDTNLLLENTLPLKHIILDLQSYMMLNSQEHISSF